MAEKTILDNPKVTDTIIFDLDCPGSDGCLTADPYKVDRVTIYQVERDFMGTNWGEYEQVTYNPDLEQQTLAAEAHACQYPTQDNIASAVKLRAKLESAAQRNTYYFKDRQAVKVIGTPEYPAWLVSDQDNAFIERVGTGQFRLKWEPLGSVREGDYFVCWTWTPHPAGESLSSHVPFHLLGDPAAVITIPSHLTPESKYEILLERYLPEMYKFEMRDDDLTPIIIDAFNKAVAAGFKVTEDMANQLIDLFDANALHESLLAYLSNLFNLKLKSSDPTLWRRQIKESVKLFKQKGTQASLEMALSQAGMKLEKITRLWQVVSKYVWKESFKIKADDTLSWKLTHDFVIQPSEYLDLRVRRNGSSSYDAVSVEDNVEFVEEYGSIFMNWIGQPLDPGDIVVITYQHREIPNGPEGHEALLEKNCVHLLPLADQRDETAQEYPPKNWNVRVIEEDDPLFNVLIPVRHPYHDWLVFGWVRTEFPYSENIYNMEEYNGSTRDSYDACYIDKSFLDPCGACLGSKFNLDVSIQELSDDRIAEVRDIIEENMPFHAQLHSLNIAGEVNEFIQSPEEAIETLVTMAKTEFVISGVSNPYFHRDMFKATTDWAVKRNDLAAEHTVASGTGVGYNTHIKFVSPLETLRSVSKDHHILEVFGPSPNEGSYTLANSDTNSAVVASSVNEPVNQSMFTFRLSNINYSRNGADIYQKNVTKLTDASTDFTIYQIKSSWDGDDPWKISLAGVQYNIENVEPGNVFVLANDGSIPVGTSENTSYVLLNSSGQEVTSGTATVVTTGQALVDTQDPLVDIEQFIQIGDYLHYNDNDYLVTKFASPDETEFGRQGVYIQGYTDGNAIGVRIEIRKRIVDNAIGYFGYSGLLLDTSPTNYEQEFGVVDGANSTQGEDGFPDNSNFTASYMVKITSGDQTYYYKIEQFDGTTLTLSGLDQIWGNASGTPVDYDIIHFQNDGVESQWMPFDQLDRRGKDPVERRIYSSATENTSIVALSMDKGSTFEENVSLDEGVTFEIEYKDGETKQGEL